MQLEHKYVLINDVNIHYVTAGPKKNKWKLGSTLIFLHGFPEYWQTWQHQLDYFHAEHRVIAPDLPGYNLSGKPQDVLFYQITHLVKFMAAFIDKVSPEQKVTLVAHDWGGVIAWPLAAFYSQYIEKLVILNAAHPSTFTRETINNSLQRDKSAYIHDLIGQDAETLLSKNDYQYLTKEIMVSTKPGIFDEVTKERYRQVWGKPGAINGMLQYYRAMPQLAAVNKQRTSVRSVNTHDPVKNTTEMKVPNIRIDVPTLILWGEKDQAFVNENLDDLEPYVPHCTIKRFADTSHWLMHEKSDEINSAIDRFINSA